jgi:type II restriction/modification system DNA methylase subunit YeeA
MTPHQFIAKWQAADLKERAACQEHFLDLCAVLGDPHAAGHFLMKLMFRMFAEDIDLLPKDLFLRTVRNCKWEPAKLSKLLANLFDAMANKDGTFGADEIPWFNGGLFKDAEVIDLTPTEIRHLEVAATYDWSAVEPSIFGTLFERILNPAKRSQLGAHYTSRDDILTLLEPVMMAPLRREWAAVKAKADQLWDKAKGTKAGNKPKRDFERCVFDFLDRLTHVTVLDPACGSGNFLYVALHLLLDLEKDVLTYATSRGISRFPFVRPTQLHGIEVNPYAQELAQVVIWIGFLQWMKFNGFIAPSDPVLDPMESIQNRDAILDLSDPAHPTEPDWPDAEFVVGNPPFLGGKMLRTNLGDGYVDALFRVWGERVRPEADLVVYWFEKARAMIEAKRVKRAGLLATQGIRGGANRDTLARIKQTGDIFFAVSDREWFNEGAAVHISLIGFDDGSEKVKTLDGTTATTINANLTSTADITQARRLAENANIGFMGDTKGGPFDIELAEALKLLRTPNVNGRPSSDVVTPWCNGKDVTQRGREMWIIDFGVGVSESDAEKYDAPFGYLKQHVEGARGASRSTVKSWWLHERPRVDMRGERRCKLRCSPGAKGGAGGSRLEDTGGDRVGGKARDIRGLVVFRRVRSSHVSSGQ